MKAELSSTEKVVTEAKAIALLMHPTETIYLKPFMTQALSVSQAADILKVSMNFLYYRIKRFEQAGLLEKVKVQKRRGRAIAYYQASARSFFVPFSATDKESLEQLVAAHDEHWQPHLQKGIAEAYKASGLHEDYWGVRIDMMGELMAFGIKLKPTCESEDAYPKGMINFWDTRHYLSDEDVTAMKLELNAILNKYLEKHTGPRKVLHVALATWPD